MVILWCEVVKSAVLHGYNMFQHKMASMDDRKKSVEDKKQELLRRIAEKKKNEQSKMPPLPSSSEGNTQKASRSGTMFVNDGNFLARFQAMQQQKTSAPSTSAFTSIDSRPTVSMKLTTVKRPTPVKPVSARPDVFEAPEDLEENGNFILNSKLLILDRGPIIAKRPIECLV